MRINYKEHGRQYNLKSVNTKTETYLHEPPMFEFISRIQIH